MPDPSRIFCLVRKEWVFASPEEVIRQQTLAHLLNQLGYPESHLAVEKNLRQMPHLQHKVKQVPDRRVDIVCFARGIHPTYDLYPLLVIECKAVKLSNKVINQVVGYNHYLQARFIAIANDSEMKTGWYNTKTSAYEFIDFIPFYDQLVSSAKSPWALLN